MRDVPHLGTIKANSRVEPRLTKVSVAREDCPAEVSAARPDLHEVLDHCRRQGMTHVIQDGTLIESDRVAGVRDNGNDLWFSQKHEKFGGNIQFLPAPDGTPLLSGQWNKC